MIFWVGINTKEVPLDIAIRDLKSFLKYWKTEHLEQRGGKIKYVIDIIRACIQMKKVAKYNGSSLISARINDQV